MQSVSPPLLDIIAVEWSCSLTGRSMTLWNPRTTSWWDILPLFPDSTFSCRVCNYEVIRLVSLAVHNIFGVLFWDWLNCNYASYTRTPTFRALLASFTKSLWSSCFIRSCMGHAWTSPAQALGFTDPQSTLRASALLLVRHYSMFIGMIRAQDDFLRPTASTSLLTTY